MKTEQRIREYLDKMDGVPFRNEEFQDGVRQALNWVVEIPTRDLHGIEEDQTVKVPVASVGMKS